MKHVYLDQAHWIALAKADQGHSDGIKYTEVLEVAAYSVEHDVARFPLSAIHYMETLSVRNPRQREHLADVMARLSRFATVAPPAVVLPMEIDEALAGAFDLPTPPPTQVFGYGAGFAFNSAAMRYRPPPDLVLTALQRERLALTGGHLMEYGLLRGPHSTEAALEIARLGSREFGDMFTASEKRISQTISGEGANSAIRRDWLTGLELIDILEPVNAAFARTPLSNEQWGFLSTKEGMAALLASLPSRATVLELRLLRHENPQTRWESNDLNDVAALSVAIPYCDVVATERQWVHLAKRARLDHRFGTALLADLAGLPEALG